MLDVKQAIEATLTHGPFRSDHNQEWQKLAIVANPKSCEYVLPVFTVGLLVSRQAARYPI